MVSGGRSFPTTPFPLGFISKVVLQIHASGCFWKLGPPGPLPRNGSHCPPLPRRPTNPEPMACLHEERAGLPFGWQTGWGGGEGSGIKPSTRDHAAREGACWRKAAHCPAVSSPVDVHVLLHVRAAPQQGAAQGLVRPRVIEPGGRGGGVSGARGRAPDHTHRGLLPHRLSSRSSSLMAPSEESTTSCSTMTSQRATICGTPGKAGRAQCRPPGEGPRPWERPLSGP